MKGILIILCLSLISASCGKLRTQRFLGNAVRGNTGIIAGLEEPVQHTLKASELKIAERVCKALQTKRANLITYLTASPPVKVGFSFSLEKKDCTSRITETTNLTAQILLISNELEFSSPETTSEFVDVITDKTPAISHICDEIFSSRTPTLEDKVISNASIITNTMYLVDLKTNDKGFDTIQINTKKGGANGSFNPLHTQLITLYTNQSQVSDKRDLGVEKERSQHTPCAGNTFSTIKESFVRSVFF